jgi:Zn-dependent M28 family amino/carboxypeptidase
LGRHLGETYYGANDNASGSAVVMGLAKAFSRLPKPPKRSVLFILFGGEEMNLAGSRFFVEHPPASLKAFDAMLNFDMNGVGAGLTCYFSTNGAELVATLKLADEKSRLLGELDEATTPSGSDYAAFLLKGIPFLSFFSNNFEGKYHIPEDTYYQVNPDIMADIARIAYRTAARWAER